MSRYIDADALVKAIPNTFQSTSSMKSQLVSLITGQPTLALPAPATPPPPNGSLPAYRVAKNLVFDAPYSDASNWANGRTSAFPGYGQQQQTNPGDSKLDLISSISTAARPTDDGKFIASPSTASKQWYTQLVTTEGSPKGFQVQTGDVVACDLTLPQTPQNGQWAALWTWNGPGGEVDFFETHGDNPQTIELTNHVRPSTPDYPKLITPGKTAHIETVCGATSVDWYIDGALAYQDHAGVGANWKAYLIANLSVQAANQYHPGPDAGATSLTARIANVKVFR